MILNIGACNKAIPPLASKLAVGEWLFALESYTTYLKCLGAALCAKA